MTSTAEAWERARAATAVAVQVADGARAKVLELQTRELELVASMGQRALAAADGAETVASELSDLRDLQRVWADAVSVADAGVAEARRHELPAEAAELRHQAELIRLELAELEATVGPLLAELERLQECGYSPASRYVASSTRDAATGEWTTTDGYTSAESRTERLRGEMYVLIGKADALDKMFSGEWVAHGGGMRWPIAFSAHAWGERLEAKRGAAESAAHPAAKATLADRARALVKG